MIYEYENMSYLDYRKVIQNNFGQNGITQFSTQFGVDESTAKKVIEKYEKAAEEFYRNEDNLRNRPTLSTLDPKIVKTAHDDYISMFTEGADKDKVAYISLGNIASGKSTTIMNQTLPGFQPVIVDADFIRQGAHNKEQLSYYPGLSFLHRQIDDTERYHKATNQLSKVILKDIAEDGYNLYIPKSTTSVKDLHENIETLVNNGYTINLIQCETDFSDCADRNYYRFLCSLYQDKNARFVPLSVLKRIDDNTYRTFCTAYEESLHKDTPFNEFNIFLNPQGRPLEEIDKESMVKKFDASYPLR